ncbi:D-alanine--(R)-lactate ligase [Gordonia sp. HY002]|uniref:D-alanine--(R)-lactate ligase n=1 Tax=Gordonia zhenghanii TaxID=2911516 RepID=UPI001EF11096|nr:D-alanine--(R)-lactate ligase [Gordonia zhenghanii]MCF8570477.1 D-alanine--(R)-lactate ligase [Gordonia zhenghanii]MCF8602566.1 D-alanine--(R)-lactate ligase [Gordonia zhenghanii]
MNRLRVAVIFGGASEEHQISVKSAIEVAKNLDTDKYEPFWVGITTSGEWKLCAAPAQGWDNQSTRAAVLSPDTGVHGLLVQSNEGYERVRLDVVLPMLHGKHGEDGAIQGLLELAGIPYVGCGVQGSAVCMDKSLAYTVAKHSGIATPEFSILSDGEEVDPGRLRYPVFVKPARSGSSFGVSKVTGVDELPSALSEARLYDSKVLIEEAVPGSEVGCAVLGERFGLITGEVDRVEMSHGFFRIHQEDAPEEGSENATFIVPADISEKSRDLVQATAKTIYRALGCKGIARVDMFLTEDGDVVLNEVNTMPGMTSYSRYPRMMAASGLSLSDVIDRLIAMTMYGKKR